MTRSLFSSSWYRVADLTPRLRSHLRIHRQRFRDRLWFVLQDQQSGTYHRLTPEGHLMISLMDGRRTMQMIWEMMADRLGAGLPTQDDCIALLTQLYRSDLLVAGVTPDLAELDRRTGRQNMRRLVSHVRNPLALRFPLIDPDRFLERTLWLVRWIFTLPGFLGWLAFVIAGATLAAVHWQALTHNIADQLLTAENVVLLVLIYPVLKGIHELGHGYAAKRWGGEVHEIGIMLLVLMPVPYVDASSSLAFAEKHRRMVVGAAGIMVELALASAAMMVWINVEDGWLRAIAFNTMIIGGVSTLFFNGNPLLRFDGYYVLCDLIEIPNLGSRANRYFFHLVQTRLFGVQGLENPATERGEAGWFLFYAIASFVYRIFVVIGIALFISTKFFFVGIALAIWSVVALVLIPLGKGIWFLVTSPRLRRTRRRALLVTGTVMAGLWALVFVLPVPYSTITEGVVHPPAASHLRALTEGTVEEILVRPGTVVRGGTPLVRLSNPELTTRVRLLEAERREFELRLEATDLALRTEAKILRIHIKNTEADIAILRSRIDDLTLRAPAAGRFILYDGESLIGHHLRQGDEVGLVAPVTDPRIRVIVSQDDVDLITSMTERTDVRISHMRDVVLPAVINVATPSAVDRLPSATLSPRGGGSILTDPAMGDGLTPLQDVFEFDLGLVENEIELPTGQRVFVRFDHGSQPVAWRIWRSTRQLLLGMFDV